MRYRFIQELTLPVASAITVLLLPLAGAAQSPAIDQVYEVTLRQTTVADAPEAIAADLAAAHDGSVVDVRDGRLTLRLAATRARVVAVDPRVETVVPKPATTSRGVAAEGETMSWSTGVPYMYDDSGNVRQIGSDYFVYDVVGRLVQSDANGVRRNYEYDAYGNRTKCVQSAGTVNETDCQYAYTISPDTNRIAGATYDAEGNVTAIAGHAYSYDALNMQTRDDWGSFAWEYIYTADDERIAVYDVGRSWRWSVRDTSGKVLREFTSSNGPNGSLGTANWTWTKDYIWRDGRLLASRQIEPGGSTPISYHYHLDHLGTPRRITDSSDRIIGAHDYHAFGPETTGGQNEPSLSLMKFTGHERDLWKSESSDTLDYMHARFATPTLGRFLSVDPVIGKAAMRRPQLWNRYAYVGNNPISFVDPDGRLLQLSGCAGENKSSPACGQQMKLLQASFGKQWSEASKYLRFGKNGMVSLKGISPVAFGAKFGLHARSIGFLANSSRVHGVSFDASRAGSRGAQTISGNIYLNPSMFPQNLADVKGMSLAEAFVHETGHALKPYFSSIVDIDAKYARSPGAGNDVFSVFLENHWRRNVLGAADNDIRTFYLSPGDIAYPGTKLEEIWPP